MYDYLNNKCSNSKILTTKVIRTCTIQELELLFAKLNDDVVVDILYLVRDPRGMENSREQLKKKKEQIWTPHSQEASLTMNYNLRHACSRYR